MSLQLRKVEDEHSSLMKKCEDLENRGKSQLEDMEEKSKIIISLSSALQHFQIKNKKMKRNCKRLTYHVKTLHNEVVQFKQETKAKHEAQMIENDKLLKEKDEKYAILSAENKTEIDKFKEKEERLSTISKEHLNDTKAKLEEYR